MNATVNSGRENTNKLINGKIQEKTWNSLSNTLRIYYF